MSATDSFPTMDLDPRDISFNYTSFMGEATASFGEIDQFMYQNFNYLAIYGCSIGCAGITIMLLWIITRNHKTPIFILNQLTLLFVLIHAALYISYLYGPLASISYNMTGILIPGTLQKFRITTATNAVYVLLVATIECSISYQVYIMFQSPEVKKLGHALTAFTAALGCAVVGLFINLTIQSVKSYQSIFEGQVRFEGSWVTDLPLILFAASINVASIILVCKLFFAIRSRRFLGLKQFDVFHILFIMSTQSMVIPSVLVILNYKLLSAKYDYILTIGILLTALSLPLSSMWAASSNNNPNPTSSALTYLSKTHSSSTDYSSSTKYSEYTSKSSPKSDTDLESSPGRFVEASQYSPTSPAGNYDMSLIDEDDDKDGWFRSREDVTSDFDGEFMARTTHTIREATVPGNM